MTNADSLVVVLRTAEQESTTKNDDFFGHFYINKYICCMNQQRRHGQRFICYTFLSYFLCVIFQHISNWLSVSYVRERSARTRKNKNVYQKKGFPRAECQVFVYGCI